MIRFNLIKYVPFADMLFRTWLFSNFYEFLVFVVIHRRFPRFRRTGYLNDLLFRLRATEADLVFRAFTSDKEFMKAYVRGLSARDLTIPTLGLIRSAVEVDDYRFPPDSVVKPTHMSGEVVFVREDGQVSQADRVRMKRWFKQNFGAMTGERHYLRLKPKIIIEPWLKLNGDFCNDYKLHVYAGKARLVEVAVDRFHDDGSRWMYFDCWWRRIAVRSRDYAPFPPVDDGTGATRKPDLFHEMIAVAEEIGRNAEYVRVDFYTDGQQQLYVGEISHIPANARERFEPAEGERYFISGPGSALTQFNKGEPAHGLARR